MCKLDGFGLEPSSGKFDFHCTHQFFPLGFPGWKELSSSTHNPYTSSVQVTSFGLGVPQLLSIYPRNRFLP